MNTGGRQTLCACVVTGGNPCYSWSVNLRSFFVAVLTLTALLVPARLLAFCRPGDGVWVAAGRPASC